MTEKWPSSEYAKANWAASIDHILSASKGISSTGQLIHDPHRNALMWAGLTGLLRVGIDKANSLGKSDAQAYIKWLEQKFQPPPKLNQPCK